MLTATVDTSPAIGFLGRLKSEFPWACSVAINRTVELGLHAVRERMRGSMTIRVPGFLPPQQLPRQWRATKEKLVAELRTGYGTTAGSLGARASSIFSKFEEGGAKTPQQPVYIPTKVLRPNKTDLVPRNLYPAKLMAAMKAQSKGTRYGGRGKSQLSGLYSYFMVGPQGGKAWGIWERFGAGREVRMVWAFRKSVPIPASLRFYETGMQVINDRFDGELWAATELMKELAR